MNKNISDAIFNRNQKAVFDGTNTTTHPTYLIPIDERNALIEPKAEWELRYAAGGLPVKTLRSEIETEQKDAARIIYEPLMSAYVLSFVKNNPAIPVEAKIAMYIHIDNHSRTATVRPTTIPVVFKVDLNVSRVIELFYKDSAAATGHAKPHKEDVCQMYVFVIEKDSEGHDILPTLDSQYRYLGDSSDYHISLHFEIPDAGKQVIIRPRWKNSEGAGEFGAQVVRTIPS